MKTQFTIKDLFKMKTFRIVLTLYSLLALFLVFAMTGCGKTTERVVFQGEQGPSGKNGYSTVSKVVSNPSMCQNGGNTIYLALDLNQNLQFDDEDQVQSQFTTCNGINGLDGSNGHNGLNGSNGLSCSVTKVSNVATITCGTSSVQVLDGAKGDKGDTGNTGSQGPAGTNASGIYITEILNPCGAEFNNEEVLLKLSNNLILGLYDGGPQEDRLSLLVPGTYTTSDRNQNHSCTFTINSNYQLTNQVVH